MTGITPQVGCWYKDLQQGNIFEIVAIDEDHDAIEAQLLDGEICEYDMDSWEQMLVESVEEPEDWRTPFELSDDDSRFSDDTFLPEDWNSPLSQIEPEVINGLIDDLG